MLAYLDDHGHYILKHHLSSVLRHVTGTMAQMMAANCSLGARIRVCVYINIYHMDHMCIRLKFRDSISNIF